MNNKEESVLYTQAFNEIIQETSSKKPDYFVSSIIFTDELCLNAGKK